MDINKKIQRQHFLMRAIDHHNVDPIEAQKEIDQLEKEIKAQTKELLEGHRIELASQINKIKIEVKFDGDFKRSVAGVLIEILEKMLSDQEIKGVFRAGYKQIRQRC